MTKEKSPARRGPRYIFYFLMLAILGWFIFMQFFGADERTVSGNSPFLLAGHKHLHRRHLKRAVQHQ